MKILKTIGVWFALSMAASVILTLFSSLFGGPEELPPFFSFLFGIIVFAGPIIGTVYINRRIAQQAEEDEEEDMENLNSSHSDYASASFKEEQPHLVEFEVAGLTYCSPEAIDRAGELFYGEIVYLVKDPTNPYDEGAIKVMTDDDIHIGYVPRYLCTEIADLMGGDTGIAHVDYINYGKYCPFVHLYI